MPLIYGIEFAIARAEADELFNKLNTQRNTMNDETTPTKPPIPDDPLEQLLWKLEYAVDEAPQLAPESLVQKSLAMAALWQVQALRVIGAELHIIREIFEAEAQK